MANEAYTDVLGQRESSGNYQAVNQLGYAGKYQMGGLAFQDVGLKNADGSWTGKYGINSTQDFLANPAVQEQVQQDYMKIQDKHLEGKGATRFIGQEFNGIPVTQEGLRMASHLVGAGAVNQMLNSGEVPQDANGTKAIEYLRMGADLHQQNQTQAKSDFELQTDPSVQPITSQTSVPTTGDKKLVKLEAANRAKMAELENTSKRNQMKTAGMTDEQFKALDMTLGEYISQDLNNAGDRATFYLEAHRTHSELETALSANQDKVLFDDLNSVPQYIGNTLLSTVNTAGRILGGVANLGPQLRAGLNLNGISKEDMQMYSQIQGRSDAVLTDEEFQWKKDNQDVITDIQDAEEAFGFADAVESVTGVLGDYVNSELTTDFVNEGADIFNSAMAGESSAGDIASALTQLFTNNPGALGQATIESLPYLLVAAYSMPMTVASGWATNQQEAIKAFEKENGVLPTEQDLAKITGLTGAQAIVDMVGDRLITGGAGNLRKTVAALTGKEVGSQTLKGAAGRVVVSAAGEFVAEGGADALGQLAATAGKGEVDVGQSVGTGLLGAGSGGVTAGAIETPKALSKTAETVAKGAKATKDVASKAVDTVKGTAKQVQAETQAKEESEEEKVARENYKDVTTLEDLPEPSDERFDMVEDLKVRTALIKEETDEGRREQITKVAGQIAGSLETYQKQFIDQHASGELSDADFQKYSSYIQKATEQGKAFMQAATEGTVAQASNLAKATKSTKATQEATQEVLGSMEVNPSSVSIETAQGILDNTALKLSEPQKQQLREHIEYAKSIEEVNSDVMTGSKERNNLGLSQYETALTSAIISKDEKSVAKYMGWLRRFHESQIAKANKTKPDGTTAHTPGFLATVQSEVRAIGALLSKMEGMQQRNDVVVPESAEDTSPPWNTEDTVTTEVQDDVVEGTAQEQSLDTTTEENIEAVAESVPFAEAEQQGSAPSEPVVANAEESTYLGSQLTGTKEEKAQVVVPEGLNSKEYTKWFREAPLVKMFFSPTNKKGNPTALQKYSDLFTNPSQFGFRTSEVLGRKPTKAEQDMLKVTFRATQSFTKAYKERVINYTEKVGKDGSTFFNQDPIRYLSNENGEIQDPVIHAMGVALTNWLATSSGETLYKTDGELRGIFGLEKDARVSKEMRNLMSGVGIQSQKLQNDLGKSVYKQLGIKADKNAPWGFEEKLIGSLGAHTLEILKKKGYVKITPIQSSQIDALKPITDSNSPNEIQVKTTPDTTTNYIRVRRVQDEKKGWVPNKVIQQFIDVNRVANKSRPSGAAPVMEEVFGTVSGKILPMYEAPTTTQNTMQKSVSKLGKAVKEGIKKHQARKHFLRNQNLEAFQSLGELFSHRIAGVKDIKQSHVNNREGVENNNAAIIRSLENLEEFRQDLGTQSKDGGFFFEHNIWKTFRIGMKQNVVNPQTDKVQRAFISQEGWNVDIDTNSRKLMDMFWDSHAEFLDIDSREGFHQDPVLVELMQAMQSYILEGKWPEGAKEFVADNVSDTMAFNSLMEIAKAEIAYESKGSFNTSMAAEIDGKTNGPAIALLQYKAANTSTDMFNLLKFVGMFPEGDLKTVNDFTAFQKANESEKDLYMDFGKRWFDAVDVRHTKTFKKSGKPVTTPEIITGLKEAMGAKTAGAIRNLAKPSFMILFYGAGTPKIKDGVREQFWEGIDSQLEAMSKQVLSNPQEAFQAYEDLNIALAKASGRPTQRVLPILTSRNPVELSKQFLEVEVKPNIVKGINFNVDNTLGATAVEVLTMRYSTLLGNRQTVVNTYSTMFQMYDEVRNHMIHEEYTQGVEDGLIPADGVSFLSIEQIEAIDTRLKAMSPQMHTFFSKVNNSIEQRLDFSKSEYVSAKGNTKEMNNYYRLATKFQTGGYSSTPNIRVGADPKKAPGVLSIHQLDAAVQHLLYAGEIDGFGVHDAMFWGATDTERGGQAQNKAFFEVMKDMDVTKEAAKAFNGALQLWDANLSTMEDDKARLLRLQIDTATIKEDIDKLANNNVKEDTINKMRYVHQYADHGGIGGIEVNEGTVVTEEGGDEALMTNFVDTPSVPVDIEQTPIADGENGLEVEVAKPSVGETTSEGLPTDSAQDLDMAEQKALKANHRELLAMANEMSQEGSTAQEVYRALTAHALPGIPEQEIDSITIEAVAGTTLGSSSTNHFNPQDYQESHEVDPSKPTEIFDALPQTGKVENAAHKAKLRSMVTTMVNKLVNPMKVHMMETNDSPNAGVATETDIYLKTLAQGTRITSGMLAQTIAMSNEEIMAHEMNHVVFKNGFKQDNLARSAVERMFLAAREQLDHTVFLDDPSTASASEIEGAKQTWNHLFQNKGGHQLREFAAFGTTNENFIKHLNTVQMVDEKVFEGTPYEVLVKIFQRIVSALSGQVYSTRGKSNEQSLNTLLDEMLRISTGKKKPIMEALDKTASGVGFVASLPLEGVAKAVNVLATSNLVKKYKGIRTVGRIVAATPEERAKVAGKLGEAFDKVADNVAGTKISFMRSVYNEMAGRRGNNSMMRDLSRKSNILVDQTRKQTKEAMVRNIKESFVTPISDKDWEAMNKILIKLDIDAIESLGMEKVKGLLRHPKAIDAEIQAIETQLSSFRYYNFYSRMANNLGYYLNTGKGLERVTLLNAHNIARLYGDTDNKGKVSEAEAQRAEILIDRLATLRGLQHSKISDRALVLDIMNREEVARLKEGDTENNGPLNLIMQHRMLKQQAKKRQFTSAKEAESLFIKGYTKETYKAGTDVKQSTLANEAELLAQGYIRGNKLDRDPTDVIQDDIYLYHAPDGQLAPYMATIASLTSNVAKGKGVIDVALQTGADLDEAYTNSFASTKIISRRKELAYRDLHRSSTLPTSPTGNYMVPIVNPKGEVTNWRYMMTEHTKDTLLGKENNVAEVLGAMAGNIVDKTESPKINRELVELTKTMYDDEGLTRRNAYVRIGPGATDPELRQVYARMPEEMREEIRKVWGGDTMMIRNDLLHTAFGYRKPSIAELFSKSDDARRAWERMVVMVSTALLGNKAALKLRKAEDLVQALVAEIKDIFVVKSTVVTISNMLSNTMFLVMNGVSPVDALTYQAEALFASSKYIKTRNAMLDIHNKLANEKVGPTQRLTLEAEATRLREVMLASPVHEAVILGLLPSIVDDVAADSELSNSTRGKAQKAISRKIDSMPIPSLLGTTVKTVLGLPDTPIYRMQNQLVMQSDFISRYAMLKDRKAKNPSADLNEIAGEAEDMFINFNTPTHRGIQYANDIGLAWFTKYKLRVQKTIAKTINRNPTQVVNVMLGAELSGMDPWWDTPIGGSLFGGTSLTSSIDNPLGKAFDLTDMAGNIHSSSIF